MKINPNFKWRALMLALPLAAAACQPETKTAQTSNLDPGEQTCAARAAEAAGVDVSTVSVAKTTSKLDDSSVYTATVGQHSYMCVTDPNQKITQFEQKS